MHKSKVIAGVEIGTNKVAVLLGEIQEGKSLNVIGFGHCSSRGVLKGEIIDFYEASDCAHAAILAAENQAKVKIDGVYLALSGGHIRGRSSEASVNITSTDGRVTREDIEHVSAMAKERDLPENCAVIHHLRRPYALDGRMVEQPIAMEGERLEANYWTVYGDDRIISDAIHIINGFNLHVDDVVLSGLASSVAVATLEEKKNGVLVIDIGRGSTDYAVFMNGRCMSAGCIPIGGDHISNDLSIGLRIRLKQADSLKHRYGSAIVEHKDKTEKVWLNNDLEIGDRLVPLWSIEKIVELRVRELFNVVRKKLGALARPERLPAGVVLCGGTSHLRNIEICTADVFETRARIGDNGAMASEELRDSQYSVALGLLHYGLRYQNEHDHVTQRNRGFMGKLKGMFQKV